jgi:DNA invertase Pin-like site-specific DNA recombinase
MRKINRMEPVLPALLERKKVAAYARVSQDSERLMRSLSAQVSFYSAYIQKNPEWEYAGVYADGAVSGTGTEQRDEFNRMIADCRAGKINIVLTKSISRFARNTVDLLDTVRRLKEIGVEVRFEKEHIHSLSEDGELMLTLLASFAQEESRSISENVRWAIRKGFEKGKQNGNRRIYGYEWDGEKYVIVPEEAEIVRLMFSNYISGVPLESTVRQLNEMGVKTLRGYDFTSVQIAYILQNERYCGDKLLQKRFVKEYISHKEKMNEGELPMYYIEDCHEAIVDRNTFRWVQEEIKRRRAEGHTAQPGIKTYCFTNKIFCGECGRTYARATNHYKVMPPCVCWTCKTKKTKGESCKSRNLPEEALKKAIAKAMGLPVFDEAAFMGQVEKIVSVEPRDIILHLNDGRTVREPVIMKGYKKEHYPPEVLAYRAEQRRLKKLRKETENGGEDNSDIGND